MEQAEKAHKELKVSHVYSLRESENKCSGTDLGKTLDFSMINGKFVKIQLLNNNFSLLIIEESLKQEQKLIPS